MHVALTLTGSELLCGQSSSAHQAGGGTLKRLKDINHKTNLLLLSTLNKKSASYSSHKRIYSAKR